MKIDIYGRETFDSDEVKCGSREAVNALDAVKAEISERPADTAGFKVISANDDDANVSAFLFDEGYEVHIYVGESDYWFDLR